MSIDATMWAWAQKVSSEEKLVLLAMTKGGDEDHNVEGDIHRWSRETGLVEIRVHEAIQKLISRKKLDRVVTELGIPGYHFVGCIGYDAWRQAS